LENGFAELENWHTAFLGNDGVAGDNELYYQLSNLGIALDLPGGLTLPNGNPDLAIVQLIFLYSFDGFFFHLRPHFPSWRLSVALILPLRKRFGYENPATVWLAWVFQSREPKPPIIN